MEILGLSRDPNTPCSPIFPAPIQTFLRDFHSGYARVPSVSNSWSGATLLVEVSPLDHKTMHLAMQAHLSIIHIAGGWGCNKLAIHFGSTGSICRINAMLWIELFWGQCSMSKINSGQWCHQGGACGFICTQSMHLCAHPMHIVYLHDSIACHSMHISPLWHCHSQ